jgi:hypothetical protein
VVSKQIAADKVRPDLTIEKWPAIWRPANSRGKPNTRTLQRKVTLRNGGLATARVEIGFTQLGNLTTEDQKTYYGLIKQWENKGRSSDYTFFSIRKLARILKKPWGTNVIESTTESLRRLRTTPFAWTNSYHDGQTGEDVEILDTFTILSELKIIRHKSDGHVTREAGYFRFHDMMMKNLLANHTKPVLLDVILGFRSEIAQLLYSHLDLMLARNDHYERRTKELFDDLGLHGTSYRNRSDRRRKLDRAVAELQDIPLSTGVLASAVIKKTKDSKDYKVVFRKAKRAQLSDTSTSNTRVEVRYSQTSPHQDQEVMTSQAGELVSHFYKVFHRIDKPYPMPREVAQATSLIARHGFERAKYIVDFSHGAADRTNYSPQTFGGILQYTSRGLADFDYYERLKEIGRSEEASRVAREQQDRAERAAVDERLKSLSEGEYQRLYETVKRDFAAKFPLLAAIRGNLFESAIRARMAEILDRGDAPQL